MKYLKGTLGLLISIVILGTGMDAFGFLGFGGDSWKEEVLLHDGRKIIIKRSQSYGGRGEVGQTPPIKEQDITFTLPGTNKTITWKSEYSEDVGRANFKLLALHILDGTPYVVAIPNLCLSYNKWGRPNPPYVFFKYTNETWQRIPLSEFPVEFKDINVVIDTKTNKKTITAQSPVPAELVRNLNNRLTQPEYKTILREPLAKKMACGEMIRAEDGWLGIDWFTNQPTYEACLEMCERQKVSPQNCPCDRVFNKSNTGK
ncbi:MAG: hypothetical protein WCT30_00960 [Desulfurivibrionaceae bacterium]|jgi:hypothetical protein